jgi:REP-associated tyrosine transposase
MPLRPIKSGSGDTIRNFRRRSGDTIRNYVDAGASDFLVTTDGMPRLARAVVPGFPHHITQRGNRRQQTFFHDEDYALYRALMAEWCHHYRVEIWAYCLMPNHAHLIAVPETSEGLRCAVGEAHRRYTAEVNRREKWVGHLWQGRFSSFVMDDRYLLSAARYVELNPVSAGLVSRAEEYPWSSARAHLFGRDDGLVTVAPLLSRVDYWSAFLDAGTPSDAADQLRRHEKTGRPLGSDDFIDHLERLLNRVLRPRKSGPVAHGAVSQKPRAARSA